MSHSTGTQHATNHEVALVIRLRELKRIEDRGSLAALRSGLGKPPGTVARMFPIVAPFLHANDGPSTHAAFLTAALFASHPDHQDGGTLGSSLWRATKRDSNPHGKHGEAGVEARFAAALDANPEDLQRHLEGLVALCESGSAPIDWNRLYWDIRSLLGDDEVRRNATRIRWARDFWQGPREQAPTTESNEAIQE